MLLFIHINVCVYTYKFILNICVFYVSIIYKIESALFLKQTKIKSFCFVF